MTVIIIMIEENRNENQINDILAFFIMIALAVIMIDINIILFGSLL